MPWWSSASAAETIDSDAAHQIVQYIQYGPGWTAGAIFLSAFVAVLAVAQHRIVAKKRAAYDFILTTREKEYKETEQIFLELAGKNELDRILTASTSREIEEKLDVQNYVNLF